MQLYEKFPAQFLNFIDKQCDKQYSPWGKKLFSSGYFNFFKTPGRQMSKWPRRTRMLLLAIILEGIGIENK